jgi:Domain of unknown function (DUF3859)
MRIGTLLMLALIANPSFTSFAPLADAAVVPKPHAEFGCEIIDAGLYVPTTPKVRYDDANSVSGDRYEIEDVKFTKQTKVIPLERGKGFGIRYRLRGLSKVKESHITWRIFYPRAIRGKSGWEHSDNWASVNGELVQHLLYDFSADYEMVAGTWRFHVLVDNKPTCAVTFQVQ